MTYIPDDTFKIILDFCRKDDLPFHDTTKQTSIKNKDNFLKLFSNIVFPLQQKQSFYHENQKLTPSMIKFYSKRHLY